MGLVLMRSLAALLLLSGCASFDPPKTQWTPGPADWKPAFVMLTFKADVSKDCKNTSVPAGRSSMGCTRYTGSGALAYAESFVQWQRDRMQTFCYAVHELRHGLLQDEHGFGDSSCGTEGLRR